MRNCGREDILAMILAARQIFPQAFDFARNNQVFVPAQRDAVLGGESLRAFGDEIDVRAFTEDLARGADGVGDAFHASYTSSSKSTAVHDEGVELDLAIAIEEAAAAGVEGLVVFHDDYGFFDCVEGRAAALEDAPSSSGGVADAIEMSVHHVIGNGPGAAVDDQNRIDWQTFRSSQEFAATSLASWNLGWRDGRLCGAACDRSFDLIGPLPGV